MINNIRLTVITGLLLCGSTPSLFAMGSDYRIDTNGNIVEQQPDWPAGLLGLVNSGPVFHGHWVNANSEFFFLGNTASLTRFIQRYATLKNTPLVLVVHAGSARRSALWGDKPSERYDWKVSLLKRGWGAPKKTENPKEKWVVTVDIWIDNNVKLTKLAIPKSVKVRSAGEIEVFISKNNDAQPTDALDKE
jgi:hypothetical protein